MKIELFDSESMFGYKQITTFFQDFSIADKFGVEAIKDTFKRAFRDWKNDYKYLTELVMVLNWKLWIWYQRDNTEYSELYEDLWTQADNYAMKHLKGSELDYFLKITD